MPPPRRVFAALCFVLLAAAPGRAQESSSPPPGILRPGAAPIQATDLYKIRQLSDVAVGPGGRSVVYTVKRVVQKPDSAGGPAYRTQLFRVDAGGRSAPQRPDQTGGSAPGVQLTFGETGGRSPAWHPSGDRIAFVRSVEGTPQIFVLPVAGGEAYQLTDAEHGATAPAFSPDGAKLLFASRLPEEALREATGGGPAWPAERPGRRRRSEARAAPDPDGSPREVRAYLAEKRDGRPRVMNRLDFLGEHDLEPALTYRHLFVMDVPGAPPADGAFPEATRITEGFASFGGGSWMPGGGQVVVSGAPGTGVHLDRVRQTSLYTARADGSGMARLLSMNGHALSRPRVAPGGGQVAFRATALADSGYAQGELGLYRTDGSAPPRLLTEAFDRSVGAPQWSPDGWHLYATASSEGGFPLYRFTPFAGSDRRRTRMRRQRADTTTAAALPPDSLAPGPALAPPDTASTIERLTSRRRGIRSFDVGRASVFYVVTEPENPYELYANSGAGFERERRLTAHNAAWLAGRRLSVPQSFTARSDTFAVDAWAMRPTTERKGTPAPLLVEIHGGPAAMWGPGEATMWHEFQYFAAQGYALVYSNPRGSGGYGLAFKKANYRDWGRGPTRDVLAAADSAAALPWTDAARQVVTGGSYAGYLTAWIVAHTDRFEAAVAQRGVYDLTTFLGEGNAWRLVPWHFGGFPWNDAPEEETAAEPVLASGTGPADPGFSPDTTTAAPDTMATSATPDAAAADSALATEALSAPRFASAREALVENSPITFVDQIRTPLLIMHADEDLRTGVTQSEMLYRSLKILGRPVEYVRYPGAGHDLSRTGAPAQRLDRTLRIWEFFERYL